MKWLPRAFGVASTTGAAAIANIGVVRVDGVVLASAGESRTEASITVPVRAEGAHLAAVLLGPRSDGRPHSAQALAALGEVAGMAAVASAAIPASVHADRATENDHQAETRIPNALA